jgi:hypothetical protein
VGGGACCTVVMFVQLWSGVGCVSSFACSGVGISNNEGGYEQSMSKWKSIISAVQFSSTPLSGEYRNQIRWVSYLILYHFWAVAQRCHCIASPFRPQCAI